MGADHGAGAQEIVEAAASVGYWGGDAVHWTDQTETMVNVLAETQKQMWKHWFDGMPGVPSPTPLYWDAINQGCESAAQGFKTWTAESEQVAKDVAERLLTTQDNVLRFLELSLRAWKAMAPKIESGEDWQPALRNYTENLRQQLLRFPQEMQKAFQDNDELWRLYREQWKGLVQPWAESLRHAPWHFGQASTGNGSALMELPNLYWDAYESTFGRLLESPSLGLTREMNADLLKGFDAWLDYRRASFEYQVTLGETWIQAFEELMRNLVALAERGETVPSVKTLLLLWIEVVDRVFTEAFSSEKYIRIQGRLVNTATAYQLREREIVDAFLKASHLASRSVLDEAYRRIYELRKDVKDLKKAWKEIQAELAEAKANTGTPRQAQGVPPGDQETRSPR
jgi:class III poly(R)-hydroxyalkanoic acid synthase PhaE subunit